MCRGTASIIWSFSYHESCIALTHFSVEKTFQKIYSPYCQNNQFSFPLYRNFIYISTLHCIWKKKSYKQRSSFNSCSPYLPLSLFSTGLSWILQSDTRKIKYSESSFIKRKKGTLHMFKYNCTSLQSLTVIKNMTLNLLYWQISFDKQQVQLI